MQHEPIAHTHRVDDPLCGLIVTHRRTGVAAARAAEAGPPELRQMLFDLSDVVLDAGARLAGQGRSEGIPVGEALHTPLDLDGAEHAIESVSLRLQEDLTHTELLASSLACESCVPVVAYGHDALTPFVEPIRRLLGPAMVVDPRRPRRSVPSVDA